MITYILFFTKNFFSPSLYKIVKLFLKLRVFATVVVVVVVLKVVFSYASSWLFLFVDQIFFYDDDDLQKNHLLIFFLEEAVACNLRVDCDDLTASASDHQDSLEAFCQHLEELHVWNVDENGLEINSLVFEGTKWYIINAGS